MAAISGNSIDIVPNAFAQPTPAQVAARLAAGMAYDAFVAAQGLVASQPNDPEAFLMMAIAARNMGQPQFASETLRIANGTIPGHPTLQILGIIDEVESGRFSQDPTSVGRILSPNLDVEDTLFQISQKFVLGNETAITIQVGLYGVNVPWTIQRNASTIACFGQLYHWMPKFHNSVENVDVFYQNYAKYARHNDDRNARQQAFFRSRLQLWNGMTVLDAGCGSGSLLKAFGEVASIEAFGVDVSPEAEPHFKRNCPHANFWAGDLVALPYADSTFDLIVSTDTLEHTFKPGRVVQELVRVAKPDSTVIISVPDGRTDRYIGHVNYFSGQSLEFLLEEFGKVSVDYYFDGLFADLKVCK